MPEPGSCAIGILARAPVPGRSKTRLAPLLGVEGAARFQRAALLDTVALVSRRRDRVRLFLSPLSERTRLPELEGRIPILGQGGGTLGTRMVRALGRLLRERGVERALLIGADSPDLPPRILQQAARALRRHPAVLAPAHDGGYVLFGLRRGDFAEEVLRVSLRRVPWSTPRTFAETVRALRESGSPPAIVEPWRDVDEPDDLRALERRIGSARRAGADPCPQTAELLRKMTLR
jgi:rSAM/selenodomain-associated transferase 1